MANASDISAVVADRLCQARKRRGLTQAEVAMKSGLRAAQISHFETGERTPSARNLVRLCRALRVSADWVLGLTDGVTNVCSLGDGELSALAQKLSDRDRRAVLLVAQALSESDYLP